ncbi:MAG: C13 family peptidase [Alphaproteobacteria bacterium]
MGRIRAVMGLAVVLLIATMAGASAQAVRWKAVLVAGDDSIPVFDNAVRTLSTRFKQRGIAEVRILSSARAFARGPQAATTKNLFEALDSLKIGPSDGCLLYFTSHGTEHGLYLKRDRVNNEKLYPEDLEKALDTYCDGVPTIAVISGCHSGTFLRDGVKKANRIILTAARRDRSSFGCDFRLDYTYFDGCLLDEIERSATWHQLFDRTVECVEDLETGWVEEPSQPQAFFGKGVESLSLPRRGGS